jgi:hypothetical protein
MPARTRCMVFCVGLTLALSCAFEAFAQSPSAPQPDPAGGLAAVEVPSQIPWDAISWTERRYKIEAVRFKARHETGIEWLGSDEVMIQTWDAKGWTVSDQIGGIDSGETHNFDPAKSCIVAVRAGVVIIGKTSVCDDVGEPAPLGFSVEFWEKDPGLPPWGFCAPGVPEPGGHAGPHCADDRNGDDFIGRARIDYSMQELEAALPNVGDQLTEGVALFPCQSDVCGGSGLGDYTFTFRVTRLPDLQVHLKNVLEEAMRTVQARSELEAIIAGLRSLRAPSPRRMKAE